VLGGCVDGGSIRSIRPPERSDMKTFCVRLTAAVRREENQLTASPSFRISFV
jgi:hypothetical protein